MKELPKVYVHPFDKKLQNNSDLFYGKMERNINIQEEIYKIFHSKDFVYKSHVEITTQEGVFDEILVGKTRSYLLTMDGKRIAIEEIIDIKKL